MARLTVALVVTGTVVTGIVMTGLAVAAAASAQELMKTLREQDVVCTDETEYDAYLQAMVARKIETPGKSCFAIEEPTAVVVIGRVKAGKSKIRIAGGQKAGVVGWTDAFP